MTNRPDLAGQYVYFARGALTKLIKIGYSKEPVQRLEGLGTSSGEEIEIILTIPGTRRDERKFHLQFRTCRERREWFREEGRLHAFLRERHVHFIDVSPPVISVAAMRIPSTARHAPSVTLLNVRTIIHASRMRGNSYKATAASRGFTVCLALVAVRSVCPWASKAL